MAIGPNSLITEQSVSPQAAWDKLEGTPLKPWAQLFIDYSLQFGIDLNWILSYLQWENGFGMANSFSIAYHDPWDLVCGYAPCSSVPCCAYQCIDTRDPGNGYCYANFASMEDGILAGYLLWNRYVQKGWNTWYTSLSVALCGNPAGCPSPWVDNVIAQGDLNSRIWPVSEENGAPDGGGQDTGAGIQTSRVMTLGLGLVLLGGAYYAWRTG